MKAMKFEEVYKDVQGVPYSPLYFTESYCYLRSDYYGHVRFKMCPLRDGVLVFKDAYGFKPSLHDPIVWMQQNSISLPERYYSDEVKKRIVAVKGEEWLENQEQQKKVRQDNENRLAESRRRLLENE